MSVPIQNISGSSYVPYSTITVTPVIYGTSEILSASFDAQRSYFGFLSAVQFVAGEWRDEEADQGNIALRPFRNNSEIDEVTPKVSVLYTGILKVPSSKIPGTDYISGSSLLPVSESFGNTSSTRGYMICGSRARNAKVGFYFRAVELDGSGSFTSTGPWNFGECVHPDLTNYNDDIASNKTPNVTNKTLFPTGAITGSYMQCVVAYCPRNSSANPSQVTGWYIYYPKLESV